MSNITAKEFLQNSLLAKTITSKEGITDLYFHSGKLMFQTNEVSQIIKLSTDELQVIQKEINYLIAQGGKSLSLQSPTIDIPIDLDLNKVVYNWRINVTDDSIDALGENKNLTIRVKKLEQPKKLKNNNVEQLIKKAISNGENIIIAGETGSGKTEIQRTMCKMLPKFAKVSIVEDTPELRPDWLFKDEEDRLYTNYITNEFANLGLIIHSLLRQNPDYIIIAEIRSEGIGELLNAMQTGHSSITTIHANGAVDALTRISWLVSERQNINFERAEPLVRNLIDKVIFLKSENKNGKTIRYIDEIISIKDNVITTEYINEIHEATYE